MGRFLVIENSQANIQKRKKNKTQKCENGEGNIFVKSKTIEQ